MKAVRIHSHGGLDVLTYDRIDQPKCKSDSVKIKIKGKQAHGSAPWSGADPIVAGAQIINNLQTIVSRNLDLTNEAAGVSYSHLTLPTTPYG